MAEQRQYWVVSPNVKNDEKTVGDWKEEILRAHVAIMGWSPTYRRGTNRMGPQFAGEGEPSVQRGDIVLVARSYGNRPDVVGVGVVDSELWSERLPPCDEEVYLRHLEPFKRLRQAPRGIPLGELLLKRRRALNPLHPRRGNDDQRLCEWMEEQLGPEEGGNGRSRSKTTKVRTSNITEGDLQKPPSDHKIKTRRQVIQARKVEAQLLRDYELWLEKRGRKLTTLKYNGLQCDGWEEERRNLIEAKGSTTREDIRMAVGQLFDYRFQGRERCNQPNLAILLPNEPDPDSVEWLTPLGIKIIWRKGRSFRDNASGQFTIE